MMYTSPKIYVSSFNCPHCGAFAAMEWSDEVCAGHSGVHFVPLPNLRSAVCSHCAAFSLWITNSGQMIYPFAGVAPLPNSDLPDDILADYREARDISGLSPRGAAALLRLCIQKLCIHLGQPGKDINSDVAALVKNGLNPRIQKSLDIVRVIGNESVHPGTIDLRDDPAIANTLFALVNIIADALITQPKLIDEAYALIPEPKRKAIVARDSK